MSNYVKLFDFHSNNVRLVEVSGEPWFVAKDVMDFLGLTDDRNHLNKLGPDEKRHIPRSNVNLSAGTQFPNRGANCVSESGLYKLIMRSDKPEAKPFQDWVTRVVLPTIRREGAYVMGEETIGTGEADDDLVIARAMQVLERKLQRKRVERAARSQGVLRLPPPAR